jgi:hypothetical protein
MTGGVFRGQPHHHIADDVGFPLSADELRIEAFDLAAVAAIEARAIRRGPRTARENNKKEKKKCLQRASRCGC